MKSCFALILAGVTASAVMAGRTSTPRVACVDPFIGTGAVAGGLSGNNYPGATVPFGMVQLCPDTHEAPDWYNASGEYDLGIPLFDQATVNLRSGKKFVVKAKRSNADAHRVREVKLNGKPLKSTKISNVDILAGGELEFSLD